MLHPSKTAARNLSGPRYLAFKFFVGGGGTQGDCRRNEATMGTSLSNTYSLQKRAFSSSLSWSPLQRDLLQRALQHVPEHGWTQDAIAAAAASSSSLNQSVAVTGLVTVQDLIAYCMQDWNERLRQELNGSDEWKQQQHLEENPNSVLSSLSLSPHTHRIAQAFQIRLQYEQDLLPVWHQGMALGARPDQVWKTQEQLKEMVEIVIAASSDNNGDGVSLSIPARLSLGAVYVAAELHMLSDTSPNSQDTWLFLRQQLQHWEQIYGDSSSSSSSSIRALQDAAWVTSSVATAMASGVASLLIPSSSSLMSSSNSSSSSSSSNPASSAIVAAWNAVTQQMPFPVTGAAATTTSHPSMSDTKNDGTDPRHYDAPPDEPSKRESSQSSATLLKHAGKN